MKNPECECHFYKSSSGATNVATGMQQLATIRDMQQQCNILRKTTQRFERDRLNESTWWAKKAERICCVDTVPDCFVQHVAVHPFANHGKPFEISHGMDCSGIRAWERAIGSKCSKMKKEERGMSWSWSKMCKCAMCFGTSAHGQQGCVPSTD